MALRQTEKKNCHDPRDLQARFALPRPRLIAALDDAFRRRPAVLVEARAGQGKSWLAAQYLQQWDGTRCWFDVGAARGHALIALWEALAQRLAQMPAAPRERALPSCPQARCDALITALQGALQRRGGDRLLLVIDGAEAWLAQPSGRQLLARLLGAADTGLHLLITARPGAAARLAAEPALAAGRSLAQLDGAELDFSADELLRYCERRHGVRPGPGRAEWLLAETRGWPQGLVMLAPLLGAAMDADEAAARRDQLAARLCEYFDTRLLQPLAPAARQRLCRRALFDVGDEAFVADLLGAADGEQAILDGAGFIDSAGRLHPQLRRALAALAMRELRPGARRELHLRAALRLFALGRWSTAARYALAAGELALAEHALAASRGALLGSGTDHGLCRALLRAGSGSLASYPQLLMHRASLCRSASRADCGSCPGAGGRCGEIDPALAVYALEHAVRLFAERGECGGELLAHTELLRQLVLLDSRHGAAMPSYQRALVLWRRHAPLDAGRDSDAAGSGEAGEPRRNAGLAAAPLAAAPLAEAPLAEAPLASTAVSRLGAALGIAGLLLCGDRHNALHQLDAAVAQAVHSADLPTEVDARCLRLQALLMLGRNQAASADLEVLQACLQTPAAAGLIGPELRVRASLAQFEWLWQRGECGAFGTDCARRLEELLAQLPAGLPSGARARQWLLLRRIEQQLGSGDLAAAEQSLQAPLQASHSIDNDLLRGHLLARRGLLHALAGREAAARSDAREAAALHSASGGHCQILDSHLALAAVYLQLGDWQEAETRINEALRDAERFGLRALQAGALLQRALLWLGRDDAGRAAQDAGDWLRLMREQQLRRHPGWLSESVAKVLEFAFAERLDVALVRELASGIGRGFDARGRAVPLLRVRSLGGFEFAIDDVRRLSQGDFTAAQRKLLALLLASPEHALPQSQIQRRLWPDSSADAARSELQRLLSQLRELFDQRLAPSCGAACLSLRRGVLSLENIVSDVAEFERAGITAEVCLADRPWQAQWHLRRALAIWRGHFCPGVEGLPCVSGMRAQLLDQHARYCRNYTELAERCGCSRQAAALIWEHFQSCAADRELADRLWLLYARLRRSDAGPEQRAPEAAEARLVQSA